MDILIKGMKMPSCCYDCFMESSCEERDKADTFDRPIGLFNRRINTCPLIPVLHCKDCENFNKETNICTRWGSWTNEDGFCHKAVVLERTT